MQGSIARFQRGVTGDHLPQPSTATPNIYQSNAMGFTRPRAARVGCKPLLGRASCARQKHPMLSPIPNWNNLFVKHMAVVVFECEDPFESSLSECNSMEPCHLVDCCLGMRKIEGPLIGMVCVWRQDLIALRRNFLTARIQQLPSKCCVNSRPLVNGKIDI